MKKLFLCCLFVFLFAGVCYAGQDEYIVMMDSKNRTLETFDYIEKFEMNGKTFFLADEAAALELMGSRDVSISKNARLELLETAYDDEHYSKQWYLKSNTIDKLKAAGTGKGVRIGVIDSGLNSSHEDIVGANILEGYNYLDNNTDTTDEVSHGTFVTGIIAAQQNNSVGIVGIAPEAEIVPLKVLNNTEGDTYHLMQALNDAVNKYDCDIVNMSLGIRQYSHELETIVSNVVNAGVVLVAAVGNRGSSVVYYPAGFDGVIGVGAVNSAQTRASFSEYNSSVDIMAPGYNIYSLALTGGYRSNNGTSHSSPIIVGVLAVAMEKSLYCSYDNIMNAIIATAVEEAETDAYYTPGYDIYYGYGILDAYALYNYLLYPAAIENFSVENGTVAFDLVSSISPMRLILAAYGNDETPVVTGIIVNALTGGQKCTFDLSDNEKFNSALYIKIMVFSDDNNIIPYIKPFEFVM